MATQRQPALLLLLWPLSSLPGPQHQCPISAGSCFRRDHFALYHQQKARMVSLKETWDKWLTEVPIQHIKANSGHQSSQCIPPPLAPTCPSMGWASLTPSVWFPYNLRHFEYSLLSVLLLSWFLVLVSSYCSSLPLSPPTPMV